MSAQGPPDPASPREQARLHGGTRPRGQARRWLEPWFAPFALVNGSALGLTPILMPLVAARYGIGHVGLVMGAFNLGAFAAPLTGSLADRLHAYRSLATVCAAASAVTLWLFPLLGSGMQIVLALVNGAGFAGAVTTANLLIVERQPKSEWNQRLGWLETVLSVGQGGALFLAAWLSGLSARTGLLIAALVPAAAVPLAILLIPRMPKAAAPAVAATEATSVAAARAERSGHQLASAGQVGEWGPASPSRAHHLHQRRRPLAGVSALLGGGFGWFLAAWLPAYAGTAVVFALYPVLFQRAFGIAPQASALAFAVIVLVSLPLFVLAGRISQRRGPAVSLARGFAARVVLLGVLAGLAAVGHVPAALPLTAFAGIMFAWSFLSVASPGLAGQLRPDAEGDAQGLLNGSSGLAGLLGSVVGGAVAGSLGYAAALSIGAALVAVGLVVFTATLLRRRGV